MPKPIRRDYQTDLVHGVYRSWNAGNRNVIAVLPTGGGKTKTFASMIDELQGPITIAAHRKELVGQISLAVAEFEVPHRIIASTGTVKNCIDRHIGLLKRSYHDPRARVTIASVDTINAQADSLRQWAAQQAFWITDECFPAGTLVDGRPIETLRIGDEVTAFDETTGQFVKRPVTHLFKNPMPESMIRIEYGHHVLYATSEHPIWTKRGWVAAKDLTNDDHVLHELRFGNTLDGRTPEISVSQDRSHFLQQVVRDDAPRSESPTESSRGTDRDDLFRVRESGSQVASDHGAVSAEQPGVLFGQMFVSIPSSHRQCDDGRNEPKVCTGSHDRAEPDAFTGDTSESVCDAEGTQTRAASSGWEWKTTDERGNDAGSTSDAARLQVTICRSDEIREGTLALQDRHRTPETEDRDRGGWVVTRTIEPSGIGSAKGRIFDWCRVARVSVLERGNPEIPGDGFVYNIEVDDVHTYTANGVVVHNCHHCATGNKWSKMIDLFVNARGLGVTATPIRADRKTLARVQGGIFDDMVIGPSMREMIDNGHLCDYVIYAPPMSLNLHNLKVGASGDYTQDSVRKEAHRSQIVGDIVEHYRRFASGKRTIVFAVDVEQSVELAQRFVDAGFRASAVDGNTPETVRDLTIDKFSRGVIDILVNVDLFGEGFDVPAVECVIMGRPTQSLGLYMQQFGRALRPLPGKPHGIIIDAVGNVQFHGLPDRPRQWSLIGEERGRRRERDPEAIPVTSCTACMRTRESILRACPFCGHVEEPAGRSLPEQVAGDLQMLDPATLRAMRGEIERVDGPPQVPRNLVGTPAEKALIRNWQERQVAQDTLRQTIATWAGIWHDAGEDDPTIQRRFYFRFGTDVMTAQTLGVKDAEALTLDIQTALERHFTDRVA